MPHGSDINRANLDSRRRVDESNLSSAPARSIPRVSRPFQKWIAIPLFSAALLMPCFWQSRIQAADLASHIYNAWLASQIHQGKAPGLWISPQANNVLFDWMLEWLLVHVGPNAAQRLAVSATVLLFGWGAVLFIFRAAGRNWWLAAPCVAMLSYGFIFHMGFFNFYLSMGLCLWYLAIFWKSSWQVRALSVPFLIAAWLAHPFPVLWAAGTAAYIAVADRFRSRRRFLLLMLALAVLLDVRYILTHRYSYSWSWRQFLFATGAAQINLFGSKYLLLYACLLFLWLLLLWKLLKRTGLAEVAATLPFQLWLLNVAAVSLIPDNVMFPQFGLALGFITDRLSLGSAVMLCAVLAAAPITKMEKAALASVAILFFALLYADDRQLNQWEDRISSAIASLPPHQRVINPLPSHSLQSFCFHHDLDRACIGHCFSYANYEPSSRQFRIRAGRGNGIVMDDYSDVFAVENGTYVVQSQDTPVYVLYPCGSQNVCLRPLQVGDTVKNN
jgi:hypothetical protein